MDTLTFNIKGKEYKTKRATVGTFVDLWKVKTSLSMGTYGQMYRFALVGADSALNIIDIEAFFSVFSPAVLEDLKPRLISDMGIEDFKELREVYKEQIAPWIEKMESLLKD